MHALLLVVKQSPSARQWQTPEVAVGQLRHFASAGVRFMNPSLMRNGS